MLKAYKNKHVMHMGPGRPPVLSPLEEGRLVSYLTEGDYQIRTPQFNEKVQELAVERAVALKKSDAQVPVISRRRIE